MKIQKFLSKDKLGELKANQEQQSIAERQIVAHEVAKVRATGAYMHATERLNTITQDIIKEYGEDVNVNMETGEILLPEKADANN